MKRALWLVALFGGLFVASDALRSVLQDQLFSAYVSGSVEQSWWRRYAPAVEVTNMALYATVFGITGATLASQTPRLGIGLLLAFLLGLAVPTSSLPFEPPHPWFVQDHGNTWLVVLLSWSNWYMPPLASIAGAFAWSLIAPKRGPSQNVA